MRLGAALVPALAASLALPAAAEAKSCIRLSISDPRPAAGELVTLRLTMWLPRWEDGKARLVERMNMAPGAVFRSRVGSLRGAPSFQARYRRDPRRAWLAIARFRFPSRGTWTIDPPEGWASAPLGCANTLRARVR